MSEGATHSPLGEVAAQHFLQKLPSLVLSVVSDVARQQFRVIVRGKEGALYWLYVECQLKMSVQPNYKTFPTYLECYRAMHKVLVFSDEFLRHLYLRFLPPLQYNKDKWNFTKLHLKNSSSAFKLRSMSSVQDWQQTFPMQISQDLTT